MPFENSYCHVYVRVYLIETMLTIKKTEITEKGKYQNTLNNRNYCSLYSAGNILGPLEMSSGFRDSMTETEIAFRGTRKLKS